MQGITTTFRLASSLEDDELDLEVILRQDLKDMAKEKTGLYNRLRSIGDDVAFVSRICRSIYPQYPIAANLRCGAWYVNPTWPQVVTSPYFKSTDGHMNTWDFNLRRANLHLLESVRTAAGLIIIDSTRRGKRLPDALSKTIPIWCAVINSTMAAKYDLPGFDVSLHTSPSTVSRSEHSQIESKLAEWTDRLLNSAFELPRLAKPLRPFWVTPSSTAFPTFPDTSDFFPVICVSASLHVQEGLERRNGYCYVQGSGDDHESWSQGLTPHLYWEYLSEIQSASAATVSEVISTIVRRGSALSSEATTWTPISSCRGLVQISQGREVQIVQDDPAPTIIIASATLEAPPASTCVLDIRSGKAGQVQFMRAIPRAIAFAKTHIERWVPVRIASGDDGSIAIGIAMVVLQELFDEDGRYTGTRIGREISKKTIRRRLEWVQQSIPGVNPSRTIMNRINEYFMSPLSLQRGKA